MRKHQYIISATAVILSIGHIIFPRLSIDAITLSFVIIAILPWLAPLFKTIELPGGLKVTFQELEQAEKKLEEAGMLPMIKNDSIVKKYSYQLIQKSNPNLALAGLRLEIETRLRRIAEKYNIPNADLTIFNILNKLISEGKFGIKEGQVIQELLQTLNSAVHGAKVDSMAYEWADEIGPRVLYALDKY
jgi:hypothetical protein